MIAREPHWSGDDNFFKVHNWWHRALYHLDLGQADEVLRLYDGPVRATRSTIALDLVDASALLWRLSLCGHDPGDRWDELSRSWDQHADGRLYPFNPACRMRLRRVPLASSRWSGTVRRALVAKDEMAAVW